MIAARWPVVSPPMNSQPFLPTAMPLTPFSIQLCRVQNYAAWQLESRFFQARGLGPMLACAA
jgi:hypothetical protein